METAEKTRILRSFESESKFREFIIDFLKKKGFESVLHTHRYGYPEKGKDIIASYLHPMDGIEWYAYIVKVGRIGGGTSEIETIKGQIKQSFEYPYCMPDGSKIDINKVIVITNGTITQGAQDVLNSSEDLKSYNNYSFVWDEILIPQIDSYYPDFWLPGDAFAKEYASKFRGRISNELDIRDLSNRSIDDGKAKKLLDIFIQPILTETVQEYDKEKKKNILKQNKVNINRIIQIDENILLSGEQGAGKTRVLNKIALSLSEAKHMEENKVLPVKLKAPEIEESDYDIDYLVSESIRFLSGDLFEEEFREKYNIILLIDDLDLLKNKNKEKLISNLKDYCKKNNCKYILTFRKSDFDLDKDVKKVTIHNFNISQVESFIHKYFEGSARGERFIQILKDSDLLSRLPTTPLTITLISLLYDENHYEIPATITDIYSDFMSVLIGKLEVRSRADLLHYNMKLRLFSSIALQMLDKKEFELPYVEFKNSINQFLGERGLQEQSEQEINEIIDQSGVLFHNEEGGYIGFKQNAFVEYLASVEIYHHARSEYYEYMVQNFNDVSWQNTAIFYAGHSKELDVMIDDVINKAPNENLKDWFINTGGMGYLSQALYQAKPSERKKLVLKAMDNLIKSFYEIKALTSEEGHHFHNTPLPFVLSMTAFWFTENFKSITLKPTLEMAFDEIAIEGDQGFEDNFRLLMIASTLMNPYIDEDSKMIELMERDGFMRHHLLPLVADVILGIGMIDRKSIDKKMKKKLRKEISKKKKYIKSVLKEPAYRFSDEDFSYNKKE